MNLSKVIIYGTEDEVDYAVKQVKEINYLDEYGYTPLIESIIIDNIDKAKILLAAGANPNQKDITGRSALHWSVANNNLEITDRLLEHGANPNAYNIASEPVLARPILRNDRELKNSLAKQGGSFIFANDYINAKLLGHRFELVGSVDIVDVDGVFTEVDYEGFHLEFSIDLIRYSLLNYRQNFEARSVHSWFDKLESICDGLSQAGQIIQYDHYLTKMNQEHQSAAKLFNQDPIILPINQEGHAITIVKNKNLLAICDRSADMEPFNCINIYYINRPVNFTHSFIHDLLFKKQPIKTIHRLLSRQLALQKINELPLNDQVIGNCSWANVEAVIPTLKFMLHLNETNHAGSSEHLMADSLELFHRWREWDTHRALTNVINQFSTASPARKASIAALLAAVLFQKYSADDPEHVERSKKIIKILKTKGYEYILESYIQFYVRNKPTHAGENLLRLLKIYELEEEF